MTRQNPTAATCAECHHVPNERIADIGQPFYDDRRMDAFLNELERLVLLAHERAEKRDE